MPADAKRVQALFLAALEAPDAATIDQFLAQECAEDAELRQRVEALLEANKKPLSILNRPILSGFELPDDAPADEVYNPKVTHNIRGVASPNPESPYSGMDPSTLKRLGHYELLEVLGQGGFGIVYRAFDDVLRRIVAVKMMAPQLATTSPARKRFLREARAAAAVRHENVVQIYSVEDHPIPYLVMEYIPGETLQDLLDRTGPLSVRDVLKIGAQIARGLAAAHEMGLVHRDVKPCNIMIEAGSELRVRLTDFGLARAADEASLTQTGKIAGTPMFMAPEHARGEKVDHRADLFSLGSVLYTIVSGRLPFRAAHVMAVLKRVNEDTPRPISEIIPETPDWLCDIISRLHEKDPANRFGSAREVAEILTDCIKHFLEKSTPDFKLPARIAAIAPARVAAEAPAPPPVERRTTWKWATAAAALLAAVAFGFAGYAGYTKYAAKPADPEKVEPARAEAPAPAAASTPLPATYENRLGMKFVLVPKGTAFFGGRSTQAADREHEFAQDFYIGMYEVTQEQWEALMGESKNPSVFRRDGDRKDQVADVTDDELKEFPVDHVSWNDAQTFLKRLNRDLKEPGWTYRLPTSDEWEFASRGGGPQTEKYAEFDYYLDKPTNTLLPTQANVKETGLNRTRKVGMSVPNRLGIYDMYGNLFEHCQDLEESVKQDTKEKELLCKLRGGGFVDPAATSNSWSIGIGTPDARYDCGIRIVRVRAP